MGEQHDQKDMIDDLPHRPKYGKIYCPHCKKESPDYYDNCIHCGKDVGEQLGADKTDPPPKGWISRDSGNLKSSDRAFKTGWSVVKGEEGGSKSWQQMDSEEDSGWHDDVYQCRGCGYKQTPDEWEQKRCKECGTRNTIHPSMR